MPTIIPLLLVILMDLTATFPFQSDIGSVNFHAALFTDVSNAASILSAILASSFPESVVILNARRIPDVDTLLFAAHRAAWGYAHGRMKSRSINTELAYCIAPGRSISDCLQHIGVAETSDALIVAVFDFEDGAKNDGVIGGSSLRHVIDQIQGTRVEWSALVNLRSPLDEYQRWYSIAQEELSFSIDDPNPWTSLSNAIITRIAIKGL